MNPEPRIPEENGEYVFSSGNGDIPSCLKDNAQKLSQVDQKIGGCDFQLLRNSLREKILKQACDYSNQEARGGQKILATGHQPLFYHPGILSKELTLEKFNGQFVCINFSVDTDVTTEISAKVPFRREGRYLTHQLVLIDNSQKSVFAKLKTPSLKTIENFAQMVTERLKSLENNKIKKWADQFLQIAMDNGENYSNYRDWFAFSTRDFLKSNYLQLPISQVWETEEAKLFIADILNRYEQFRNHYNQALEDYQKKYGNLPASKLTRGELPFWTVSAHGEREKVFVDDLEGSGKVGETLLYPRAITLTLFCRLFLCDLFIHGVGGARYESATDQIIKGVYRVTPPKYAFISLTLHLPEPKPKVQKTQRKNLEEGLRILEENPEKYARCPGIGEEERGGIQSLLDEKNELVGRLKSNNGHNEEVIERLNLVNKELEGMLSDIKSDWERKLAELKVALHDKRIIEARDYPFFFYPLQEIKGIVDHIFR